MAASEDLIRSPATQAGALQTICLSMHHWVAVRRLCIRTFGLLIGASRRVTVRALHAELPSWCWRGINIPDRLVLRPFCLFVFAGLSCHVVVSPMYCVTTTYSASHHLALYVQSWRQPFGWALLRAKLSGSCSRSWASQAARFRMVKVTSCTFVARSRLHTFLTLLLVRPVLPCDADDYGLPGIPLTKRVLHCTCVDLWLKYLGANRRRLR